MLLLLLLLLLPLCQQLLPRPAHTQAMRRLPAAADSRISRV
jgi:hypothetical protein